MDGTVHMKYIDHFYQLVIKSVLTYLTDVYGHEYMAKKPSVLLVEKKKHQGERGGGWGGGERERGRAAPPRQYNPVVCTSFIILSLLALKKIKRLTNAPCF